MLGSALDVVGIEAIFFFFVEEYRGTANRNDEASNGDGRNTITPAVFYPQPSLLPRSSVSSLLFFRTAGRRAVSLVLHTPQADVEAARNLLQAVV